MMILIWLATIAQSDLKPIIDTPPERAVAEQPLVELFSYEDYPPDALRRGVQGNVRVRLLIDPRGHVQACEVLLSSEDDSLDAATCALLTERSRFRPARNAAGDAVPDFVETQLRWAIEDTRAPLAAMGYRISLRKDSAEPACVILENGETRVEPIEGCDLIFGTDALTTVGPNVAELRFESRLAPADEALEPIEMIGDLIWRYAGEFTIAPNGTVSRCTTTLDEVGEDFPLAAGALADPCLLWTNIHFQEQDQGRELRRGRFQGVFLAIQDGSD